MCLQKITAMKNYKIIYCTCLQSYLTVTSLDMGPVHSNTFMSSQVYKSKTEAAKKEYLKALAAYRASLVSKVRPVTLI